MDDSGAEPFDGDSGGTESSVPFYTAVELGEILASLAEFGLPSARVLRDSYQSLMSYGDESCPGSDTEIEGDLEGCTTGQGWYYAGLLTYVTEEYADMGEASRNFWTDTCDFQIVSPEGIAMIGGGDIEGRWTQIGDNRLQATSQVNGTWIYPPSPYPWFSEGMSTDVIFRLDRENDEDSVALNGTFGSAGVDLFFDEVRFAGDPACNDQVSAGSAWIRQSDGTWYEMRWSDDCDGCFSVKWDFREHIGSACVDLSILKTSVVAALEVAP